MTARLWITMLGVALNTMHQRRARVLAREMSSGEPRSNLSIILAILTAIALGTGLVLIKTGVLVLG